MLITEGVYFLTWGEDLSSRFQELSGSSRAKLAATAATRKNFQNSCRREIEFVYQQSASKMATMRVIAFEAEEPAAEQPAVTINDISIKEFPLSAQKALVRYKGGVFLRLSQMCPTCCCCCTLAHSYLPHPPLPPFSAGCL
jgi:hypothetical protein